jgi:hypothetical protein
MSGATPWAPGSSSGPSRTVGLRQSLREVAGRVPGTGDSRASADRASRRLGQASQRATKRQRVEATALESGAGPALRRRRWDRSDSAAAGAGAYPPTRRATAQKQRQPAASRFRALPGGGCARARQVGPRTQNPELNASKDSSGAPIDWSLGGLWIHCLIGSNLSDWGAAMVAEDGCSSQCKAGPSRSKVTSFTKCAASSG